MTFHWLPDVMKIQVFTLVLQEI